MIGEVQCTCRPGFVGWSGGTLGGEGVAMDALPDSGYRMGGGLNYCRKSMPAVNEANTNCDTKVFGC